MWQCPDCKREFKNTNQNHSCKSEGKTETVDGYIAAQEECIRPILEQVRQTIREAAPEATEKMAWQMPTYWQGQNLIHFAASKKHLGIYPGEEAIPAFADKLQGLHTAKGTIQFPYDQVDFALIAEITRWRVKCVSGKE